jgi:hypothetical protein
MAALNGAVSFRIADHVSEHVAGDLNFDMPRRLKVLF